MPRNLVKTKRQEGLWARAKAQAKGQYPKMDHDSDRFWSIVTTIYQRMAGKGKAKAK